MQVIGCAGHGCYPPRMAHHKAVRDDPLKANWTGYPDLNPQESNANYNMHVARMAKLYANQRAVSQSVDCSMPRTMKVPPPWATTHTAIHDPAHAVQGHAREWTGRTSQAGGWDVQAGPKTSAAEPAASTPAGGAAPEAEPAAQAETLALPSDLDDECQNILEGTYHLDDNQAALFDEFAQMLTKFDVYAQVRIVEDLLAVAQRESGLEDYYGEDGNS